MELKVWVEGIQRIVCGVTDSTTCQDVVLVLAHATGKSGRFTLIERWRNNERQLAANENPLKILTKWGEYSNDVQFILNRTDNSKNQSNSKNKLVLNTPQSSANITVESPQKSFPFSSSSSNAVQNLDNVGVVKGVPQNRTSALEVRDTSPNTSLSKKGSYSCLEQSDSTSQKIIAPHKDPPVPPPYRDPPPPSSAINHDKFKNILIQADQKDKTTKVDRQETKMKLHESVLYNAQYRELIALINYQREKLSNQQADLTKYDAEIVFWESKEREKQLQLEYLAQELNSVTSTTKVNQEQIQALVYVEEESEIVKQQEKTLKSEITLLRSKLANCETELLQCKNKIRFVMDEIQMEQRAQSRRNETRKQIERNLLVEMECLHRDVELAKQNTDLHHLTAEKLKKEVAALEIAIIEKKKQVEMLVQEMKEANLESLSIAPPEDLRAIFEGPYKTGSARKMIGSPRQLENAVPTNKNPHGVWV